MAAFSTMVAACQRAVALVEGGNAVVAHACRKEDGTIAVRLLRPVTKLTWVASELTADSTTCKAGAWDYVTDDAAT